MAAVSTATRARARARARTRPPGDLESHRQGEAAPLFELGGPVLEGGPVLNGGPALEDVVLSGWAELGARGEAECLVCGERMRVVGGEDRGCCEGCGSELS